MSLSVARAQPVHYRRTCYFPSVCVTSPRLLRLFILYVFCIKLSPPHNKPIGFPHFVHVEPGPVWTLFARNKLYFSKPFFLFFFFSPSLSVTTVVLRRTAISEIAGRMVRQLVFALLRVYRARTFMLIKIHNIYLFLICKILRFYNYKRLILIFTFLRASFIAADQSVNDKQYIRCFKINSS